MFCLALVPTSEYHIYLTTGRIPTSSRPAGVHGWAPVSTRGKGKQYLTLLAIDSWICRNETGSKKKKDYTSIYLHTALTSSHDSRPLTGTGQALLAKRTVLGQVARKGGITMDSSHRVTSSCPGRHLGFVIVLSKKRKRKRKEKAARSVLATGPIHQRFVQEKSSLCGESSCSSSVEEGPHSPIFATRANLQHGLVVPSQSAWIIV